MFKSVNRMMLGSVGAVAALMSLLPLPMLQLPTLSAPAPRKRGKPSAKPPRTGKLYPFSSKRQHDRKASPVVQPEVDWSLWSSGKLRWMRRHYGFRPPPPRVPPKPKPSVSPVYRSHYGDLTVDMYYRR